MAVVRPFRALRPEPHVAAAVAAVPYDVVSTDEARALVENAPLNFLHVTRAEIGLPPHLDAHGAAVYDAARANLARLRDTAPLVVEDEPALYVYRLRDGDHEQVGVAGCFSLDEYDTGVIKRHERTRPEKEDDRTRHMVAVKAQTGLVFLTYRQVPAIASLIDQICQTQPLFDFEAADGVGHTVWRASADHTCRLADGFTIVPAVYIADGHHRAASAARARRELNAEADDSVAEAAHDLFVAVAFPDEQTRILPYNRTVSDLAGATAAQFLKRLSDRVPVEPTDATSPSKGATSMYLAGRWYRVGLSGDGAARDPVSALDVSLLQDHVLGPFLNVTDVRTDPRIGFVGGIRGAATLERLVDSGRAAVAFSMAAVTVAELLAIADTGEIMPPKSTWFEPKVRDGLLVHLL